MTVKEISPYPGFFKSFFLSLKQMYQFFKNPQDIHKLLLNMADNTSDDFIPVLINPFDPMLLLKDVESIHSVLKDVEYQNRSGFPIIDYIYFQFIKELNILNNLKPELNKNMGGITFANNEDWKRNRRIGLEVMNDTKFLENSIEPILDSTDDMIDLLKESQNSTHRIDLYISQLGIDVVGKLVFGTKLNIFKETTQSGNEEIDSKRLVNSVRIMLDAIQKYLYFPISANQYSKLKTKKIKELDDAVKNLARTGTILLYKVKNEINSQNSLAALIFKKYPELDDIDIQALMMDLLGAGHDTTANLVIFTLSLILESNLIETSKEFQKEIDSISRVLPVFGENSEKIHYRSILDKIEKDSPIMSSILNETLRLFPLGAVFSRISLSNKGHYVYTKEKKYYLKPKAKLLISPYVTGRLKKDWGDTVETFDPFRFLPGENKSNAFIPFGAGKRSCIGVRFGILEAKLILFRLFQMCKFTKDTSFQKTDSILAFTLRSKHPIPVRIAHREK